MTEFSYYERTFFTEQLARLNRALALLRKESPPPDVPLQVADILQEVITAWLNALSDERYSDDGESHDTPDLDTLIQWMNEGIAEATDGCLCELDGRCEHGCQSWLLELGLI
jgi:hypothetical protein